MPKRSHIPLVALCVLYLCCFASALAQEAECVIQVNYEAIATTNKELLRDFATDIEDYIGHYNWGGANTTDKVKCTLNIFLSSVIGENRYSAQVFIGSQRPIYKSEQSTAVVRLFDEMWEFTYIKGRPINHNSYSFNDLASFLDFYMFLVMGFDADTYDKLGGTPIFQKAADIANMGRSSGQKGWQASTASYSRLQLIDEVLNGKFEPVRVASFTYHFNGLDSLAYSRDRAYANIIKSLESIEVVRKRADPRNIVIRTFFEAKYLELGTLFSTYPDPAIFVVLSRIDPFHQKTYEEYRTKRK